MRPKKHARTRLVVYRTVATVMVAAAAIVACQAQSSADDGWNPFKQPDKAPPRPKKLAPMDEVSLQQAPRPKANSGAVESSDLAPVMSPGTSGLPLDLWR